MKSKRHSDPVTAPDLSQVIAATLRRHAASWTFDGNRTRLECDWWAEIIAGDATAHQAAAVLAALTEAGTVEWGVRWHVGGCSGINKCMNKTHAERQAAKLIESGHVAVVVSRLTLPWAAVRPENPTKAWRMQHEPDAYFAEARKLAKAEAERQIKEEAHHDHA